MGNSFRVPVFDTVTEGESYNAYADEAESTENIVELAFETEFSVHILGVHNNAARYKYTPEPEPDFAAPQMFDFILRYKNGECDRECKQYSFVKFL